MDYDWQTTVTIRLVPHRSLNSDQQRLVRDEYMGGTTAQVFQVRKPMAQYIVRSFRAAINTERETPPEYLLMVDQPDMLPSGML